MRWAIAIALFFWAATAYSADTTVVTDADTNAEQTTIPYGPYWDSTTTGVIIYHDAGDDANYCRTTNSGASWSCGSVEDATGEQFAAFYDKVVPGDTGNLVHVMINDSSGGGGDDLHYNTIEVSSGTVGTTTNITTGASLTGGSTDNRNCIGKSVSGHIYAAYQSSSGAGTSAAWYSDDGGSSWNSIASPFDDDSANDWCIIMPAETTDDDDVAVIFHDVSASELSIKMYDFTADTWTETSISTGITADATYKHYDATVRHSDGAILVAAHNAADTAGDDVQSWEIQPDSIASPTVTAKTNVVTNVSEAGFVGMLIDQNTDDVYVAITNGTSFRVTTDVHYFKSTDDMGTWGSETTYSEDAADNIRGVSGGHSVDADGGRWMPAFLNDDLLDVFVNETNDVELTAGGGGTPQIWAVGVN